MRRGCDEYPSCSASRRLVQQALPTLETTTSHTRELPCLINEYSVAVRQDDSTITLTQSKAKQVPQLVNNQ
jgi:hypothetical protein